MSTYLQDIIPYMRVTDAETIDALIANLANRDATARELARHRLVAVGEAATPALIRALESPSERVRWEAVSALRRIKDQAAAPALVEALMDDEPSIRWLAATALIALERGALVPVLHGLEQHSSSIWMRSGAHHVLDVLFRDGVADEAGPVLEALENLVPAVEAPVAAYHVLQDLGETI